MRKNRAYKKGEGFKDSSLIVIACEGEKTEPRYFSFFEQSHPRKCRVVVLGNKNEVPLHKSAPKWILEKVKKHKEENQIGEGDYLFIVSDVDRWKLESLHELDLYCKEFENHFLIISNPCFEVWLYYHIGDPRSEIANSCQEWKAAVHKKTVNGFMLQKHAVNIPQAVTRAKEDDGNPNHFFPKEKNSKVYKIIEVIQKKIGAANFKAFIENY